MLSEAQGMIADFAPANCQAEDPSLWEPLVSHPMMVDCLCVSPVSGEVEVEEHPCNQPCPNSDRSQMPGTAIVILHESCNSMTHLSRDTIVIITLFTHYISII